MLWCGCSIERHYETLSFFFDGVPDPNAPPGTIRIGGREAVIVVSAHPAFTDRNCGECHGGSSDFGLRVSGFSNLDATICSKCHEGLLDELRYVHGPVAANGCLECHEPHESVHPALLRREPTDLCLECHGFHLEMDPPPPYHADVERGCLDCHGGHGGDSPHYLRPPAPSAAPAPDAPDGEPSAEWPDDAPATSQ